MVAVPPPTMVMLLPAIVATDVSELVYVKTPLLLVVGAMIPKAPSPNILVGTEKLVRTVVA